MDAGVKVAADIAGSHSALTEGTGVPVTLPPMHILLVIYACFMPLFFSKTWTLVPALKYSVHYSVTFLSYLDS